MGPLYRVSVTAFETCARERNKSKMSAAVRKGACLCGALLFAACSRRRWSPTRQPCQKKGSFCFVFVLCVRVAKVLLHCLYPDLSIGISFFFLLYCALSSTLALSSIRISTDWKKKKNTGTSYRLDSVLVPLLTSVFGFFNHFVSLV